MRYKMRILSLVVCLAIGSASWAQTTEQPEENKKARIEKLKSELDLSEEQVQKIKTVFRDQREERKELSAQRKNIDSEVKEEKEAMRLKAKALKEDRDAALSEILSKEQFEKYKLMGEERKEMHKARKKEKRTIKEDS